MDNKKYCIDRFNEQFTNDMKVDFMQSLDTWDLDIKEFLDYVSENMIFQACALGYHIDFENQ